MQWLSSRPWWPFLGTLALKSFRADYATGLKPVSFRYDYESQAVLSVAGIPIRLAAVFERDLILREGATLRCLRHRLRLRCRGLRHRMHIVCLRDGNWSDHDVSIGRAGESFTPNADW